MAIIGFCSFDIYLPGCRSLKDKRIILSSIKQKLRKEYNIAISELDYNDFWQRTLLGVVTVSNSEKRICSIFDKILLYLENNPAIEVINQERSYY